MKRPTAAMAVCASLFLSACGAEVKQDSTEGAPRSTAVNRCGEQVQYQIPQRAIAYEGGSADKLFALGLTGHVLGYVMPPANPDVTSSPFAAEYAKVKLLSTDLLNNELVVQQKADLVVAGWNSGFSEKRGITPQILDGLGVQSFMHTESCYNYPQYPERKKPLDALYADLERLGAIFQVSDKADDVVADLRKRINAVEAEVPAGSTKPAVFLYDSGTDQPATAGGQVPVNDIINVAGGTNIFGSVDERWTKATWEAVVAANPEVIMILDYKDKPAQEKIAFLKSLPALSEVPAIKNNRFFLLDYNEGISGPRNVDGAEKFGKYLRSLGL